MAYMVCKRSLLGRAPDVHGRRGLAAALEDAGLVLCARQGCKTTPHCFWCAIQTCLQVLFSADIGISHGKNSL